MAIRYRSEGFYLSFHLYLSVNVALVNEHANQLCEFGENYFGGSQKWAWLTWLRIAVFLSPVPGVQIVESGEGKKKRRCEGRAGERVREVEGKKRAGRALSSPFLLRPFQPPPSLAASQKSFPGTRIPLTTQASATPTTRTCTWNCLSFSSLTTQGK